MTEDFNEGPVVIEDKQCIFMDKENCCLCGNKQVFWNVEIVD